MSHCHSFQHSEWQIEGQTHGWRANWRAKWGSHWHSPLQFFSALCPKCIHSSSDAALISYGEVVRLSSNHHVWMSTEWQWESLHFLQSALLVWQVSTQSQRALALCPWMWASKWVTVWHQGKIDILGLIHTVRSRLRSSSRSAQSRPRIHTCHSPF